MKFWSSADRFLERLPAWPVIAGAAGMLALIGALDYITGEEIGLSLFYAVPVMFVAWYVGRVPGIVASFVAAVTWYIADVSAGRVYSNAGIPVWNAAVRLGFFLLISLLLSVIGDILEKEQDMARTDSLTGIPNSRRFRDLAEGELERARRYGRPFSVAYMDLDNFKEVNDVYGHNAGDELLYFVAGMIKENTRASDISARMGGDEFIVLLPESQDGEAGMVMERLRSMIAEGMPEYGFPVTLSIGLITYVKPPDSVEEMIRETDSLMYYVKNNTKNAMRHEVIRYEENRDKVARLRPGHGAGGAAQDRDRETRGEAGSVAPPAGG